MALSRARPSDWWSPVTGGARRRDAPRDVSPYLQALPTHCEAGGGAVLHWEPELIEATNPALAESVTVAWPPAADPQLPRPARLRRPGAGRARPHPPTGGAR